jgi:hypothetical protein
MRCNTIIACYLKRWHYIVFMVLFVIVSFFSCVSAPPYIDNLDSSLVSSQPRANNFSGLLQVLDVNDFHEISVKVEYSENSRLTFDYLAKVADTYRKLGNVVTEYSVENLKQIILTELCGQFGSVLLTDDSVSDTQITVLLDIKVKLGTFSGDLTTLTIGEYYLSPDRELLFSSLDRGYGVVPYPAVSSGLGDAKNMAVSHIYNRFLGIRWDDESEIADAKSRAALSRDEALSVVSTAVGNIGKIAAGSADVNASQGASVIADNGMSNGSTLRDQSYFQNQYNKQKRMALSMLSSLLHRTIVDDRLYSLTGGETGSRPNAALNVSLLRSYRSTQNLMKQIRMQAAREGVVLEVSDVETFTP